MAEKDEKAEESKVVMLKSSDRYYEAPEVEEIAKRYIPLYHQHLQNVPMLYFFNGGKMSKAATMSKRSEKEQFISGYKFVMEVHKQGWNDLDDAQKEALVDHELCHAYVNPDGELEIIEHDIEEFAAVVKRHGTWHKTLKHFREQFDLFAEMPKNESKAA